MSKMVYALPARRWKEALPLGNGSLAAMVYGGVNKERIALNDVTLWSGYPKNYANPLSAKSLDQARKLIFQGKYFEAQEFVQENMKGDYSESYLPLGDIVIKCKSSKKENYKRMLDLPHGLFSMVNGEDSREAFASYSDNALYYKMNFSQKTDVSINFACAMKSKSQVSDGFLVLGGYAPDHVVPHYIKNCFFPVKYKENKGMAFVAAAGVETDGEVRAKSGCIKIFGASDVVIKVVTQTGFAGYDKMPSRDLAEIKKIAVDRLASLTEDYSGAKTNHIEEFSAIFNRQKFTIDDSEEYNVVDLIKLAKTGEINNGLVNLLYDYGKYLILSGSRDSQPLNLQGQWNRAMRPPWSSNLTVNINFEMNYWPVASCNMEECMPAFRKAVKEIAASGKTTARVNYSARGFACNHNVDIWRMTTPVQGSPSYMFAPLCGMWIANELFSSELTLYGKPLAETVAICEEATRFALDYLVEKDGALVTCPSSSPEAEFFHGGKRCSLDYASAFDMGVIRECLINCFNCTKDEELKVVVKSSLQRLIGYQTTSTGINEWHGEKNIVEKGHRHFSPLYALYPGHTIKYYSTPETHALARQLFAYRMSNANNSIGWSAAWAICLYGRLHDGEGAMRIIKKMFANSLYPNLFDFHPPAYFQIDGNLGFVAGINEMLFYEENGVIDVLPACPIEWKSGSIVGQKINGTTVSMHWKDGKAISISADKPISVNKLNVVADAQLENVTLV